MRVRGFFITTLLVLSTCIASAQSGTADGVAALARGDYQQAADILKPIAERLHEPDPAAQFFMATLYEAGRGVPFDPMRACALYFGAANQRGGLFAMQADRLFRALTLSHHADWNQECQLLANIGFDHGFEPVTFTLEPGHSIAWDLRGATITYDAESKRVPMSLASRGSVFLPLRHRGLSTGATRSTTRHFIEMFLWRPSREPHSWGLEWHVFEVVRDTLVRVEVASNPVVTVSASEPPDARTFDVRAYVDLRVGEEGHAEWALLQGPRPQTQRIESDAERQEELQRSLARQAAAKRVDWKAERDVHRPPSMAYTDADGCAAIFVHGWSDNRAEAITVRADKELLQLSTAPATFDIAGHTSGLDVAIHVYALPRRQWPFCTDVSTPAGAGPYGLDETWRAVAGTITIQLSPPGVVARSPHRYRATIRITNGEFINGSGVRVKQTRPIELSALVGSWPG